GGGSDSATASDVEEVSLGFSNTGVGAGNFLVRDLSGTSVTQVNVVVKRDINFVLGAGLSSTLTVEGSLAADTITASTAPIFGGSNIPVVNTAWGRVHFNPGAAGSQL